MDVTLIPSLGKQDNEITRSTPLKEKSWWDCLVFSSSQARFRLETPGITSKKGKGTVLLSVKSCISSALLWLQKRRVVPSALGVIAWEF